MQMKYHSFSHHQLQYFYEREIDEGQCSLTTKIAAISS